MLVGKFYKIWSDNLIGVKVNVLSLGLISEKIS